MDKQVAEGVVEEIAKTHALTREEVLAIYDKSSGVTTSTQPVLPVVAETNPHAVPATERHLNINEIMYYVGAAIVVIGLTLLIGQNWELLTFGAKLFVTLGLGLLMFAAGTYLIKREHTEGVGTAFHVVAAFAMTIGVGVLIDGAGRDAFDSSGVATVSGVMLLIYCVTYYLLRHVTFAIFSIAAGSVFLWSFLSAISLDDFGSDGQFIFMRFMLLGAIYLGTAYFFANRSLKRLTRPLYSFGTLFFLGGSLGLVETSESGTMLWEVFIYPLLLVIGFYCSTVVRSGGMLVWSTIFLMIYIMILSGKYFAESIGWPVALMFAGLALIGTGFLAVTLKKKYIAESTPTP